MGERIFAQVNGLKPDVEEGKTDITAMEQSSDPTVRNEAERMLRSDADIRRQMSPPGALGLPAELERMRQAHGIIDGAFRAPAEFDRVFVWQLPEAETTYEGSNILLPDFAKKRIHEETPKGIIISAGLGALDYMWGHGIELGDKIVFIRQAPWRVEVGRVDMKPVYLIVLAIGDIVANYSKGERLARGEMSTEFDPVTKQYLIKDQQGLRTKAAPYVEPAYGG